MSMPEIQDIENTVEQFLEQAENNGFFTISKLAEDVSRALAADGKKEKDYVEREV